ncbi:MAG: AAA family ATPase [Pseudomonadota bacterium]
MYTQFFGLDEKPFAITPDPAYLYMSERHAEALAHLVYGVTESGGFVQLTGEVGTGKTTLTRSLLDKLPEHVDIALVLNPRLTVREFLETIFDELHIDRPTGEASNKDFVDALNAHLLDSHTRGRRTVLLVDEAQNLDAELLEQLRLLTNLETTKDKLLQIILVGQPELRTTLARNDLRQIAQRITGRYHLPTLTSEETAAYIRHRIAVAGGDPDIFEPAAIWEIYRCTNGVPRLVNVVCDRALLGAYAVESPRVTSDIVRRGSAEVSGQAPPKPRRRLPAVPPLGAGLVAAALLLFVASVAVVWFGSDEPAVSTASASPVRVDDAAPSEAVPDEASPPEKAPVEAAALEPLPPVEAPAAEPSAGSEPIAEEGVEPGADPLAAKPATDVDPQALGEPQALAALLAGEETDTGTDQAFRTLFSLWDAELADGGRPPCAQALAQDLKCEFQQGSWGLLRSLDRPAILSLVDGGGQLHHIVAETLTDDSVTLRLGERRLTVPLREADRFWFGEYLVMWHPYPGVDRLMLPGNRSGGVRWLRQSLESLQGGPAERDNASVYEQSLVDRVRRFQSSTGLEADGKAGIQTLVALNTRLDRRRGDRPVPRLVAQ